MIELQDVTKEFITKQGVVTAVNKVSLTIREGEVYGIIGFSGAGKSTLVRCINLLERPTSGSVMVNGQELTTLSDTQLRHVRKNIGMIFQHFNLFRSRTVKQNVMYPLKGKGLSKSEREEKVIKLLELVGLSDKADTYPSQLSGGQKQRVAIARALATDPKVLLCDEATSALDPQTTQSILKLLRELNQKLGITIVIITHEMAVIKEVCDKVAVMEHGKVVEEGEVFYVFSQPREQVTKNFIQTTSILTRVNDLIESDASITQLEKDEKILKLSYNEMTTSEPLISLISRKYMVDCNIIFASIEIIKDAPLGGTIIIISGEKNNIDSAINYLREKNIGVEVLKDGSFSKQVTA